MRYVAEIVEDESPENDLRSDEERVDPDDLAFVVDDYGGINVELVREQGKVFFDGDAQLADRVRKSFVGTTINVYEVPDAPKEADIDLAELARRSRIRPRAH